MGGTSGKRNRIEGMSKEWRRERKKRKRMRV